MTRRRVRVLHLGSPIGLYGAERWILALVKHLPTDRVESIVGVIRDAPGNAEAPICREASQLGLEVIHFDAPGKLSLAAVSAIREFIRSNDIDILHTHGYKTDILGMLAARRTSCKTVATPHGWSVNAGFKLQVYEVLDRLAFSGIDAVVPLSPDILAGLNRLPGVRRKLSLIVNGVDISEVDAAPKPSGSQALGFEIGYIGQLIPRKGIDTLIRAFARIDVTNKKLVIVGEGPQRSELEALAVELGELEQVSFLGYRPDRLTLLKGFDVFVLPSSLEGIPRCLMESMAARVPVIASNIPGCTDLVDDGVTGVLFDLGDVAALTMALQQLAGDERLRARFAESGRRLVEDRYSATAMADRYTELYQRLVFSPSR